MGLHHITWRATGSAVSNTDAIADALAWLIGDEEEVEIDRTNSYHGPELTLITATTSNKRKAMHSFARLGKKNLEVLTSELEQRMDDENMLHFRLSLNSLINGDVELVSESGTGTVKGQAKFAIYAGSPTNEQRLATLQEAVEKAERSEPA